MQLGDMRTQKVHPTKKIKMFCRNLNSQLVLILPATLVGTFVCWELAHNISALHLRMHHLVVSVANVTGEACTHSVESCYVQYLLWCCDVSPSHQAPWTPFSQKSYSGMAASNSHRTHHHLTCSHNAKLPPRNKLT